MADNLKQLTQDVAVAINPAGAPGSILAVNHKSVLTQVIEKAGKYTGLPFVAKRKSAKGIIMPGTFVWNGNAMNQNGDFIITVSKYTSDMNDVGHYLSLLAEGTLIHFKDFVGRSVILKYKSHAPDIDGISNEVFNISVSAAPENTNYTYQANENEVCMIEFFGTASAKDYFQGVELNLFWNGRGWDDEHSESEWMKQVNRKKYVYKDVNGDIYYRTLKTQVWFLGIEVKNYNSIKDFKPQVVIERYKRHKKNETNNRYHKSPSMYRSTNFFWNNILAPTPNGPMSLDRPMLIDVSSSQAYYDIFAENYFSQIDPPKALGNQSFVTYPKNRIITILDDSESFSRKDIPRIQKGYAHCRLRLRLEISDGNFIYSEPLAYFKIIDQLVFQDNGNGNANDYNVIKYSYE